MINVGDIMEYNIGDEVRLKKGFYKSNEAYGYPRLRISQGKIINNLGDNYYVNIGKHTVVIDVRHIKGVVL